MSDKMLNRVVVTIGQLLVMASLAEYCSIWPTAGGQQFYVQVSFSASSRLLPGLIRPDGGS
jgi:amino acid transporter